MIARRSSNNRVSCWHTDVFVSGTHDGTRSSVVLGLGIDIDHLSRVAAMIRLVPDVHGVIHHGTARVLRREEDRYGYANLSKISETLGVMNSSTLGVMNSSTLGVMNSSTVRTDSLLQ